MEQVCSSGTTVMEQVCSSGTTVMEQVCSSATTVMEQVCSSGTTVMEQVCSSGTTVMEQVCHFVCPLMVQWLAFRFRDRQVAGSNPAVDGQGCELVGQVSLIHSTYTSAILKVKMCLLH